MTFSCEIWRWRKNPASLLLHPSNVPLFPSSPTFAAEWESAGSIALFDPLRRPFPDGVRLFAAQRLEQFPYTTTVIQEFQTLYFPEEKGLYFAADEKMIDALKRKGFVVR